MTGQNLDYFFPHYTGNQQSCLYENYVRNARIYNKLMLYETCALQQVYGMLCKQDCVKFRGHIARQGFFLNNFADFSDIVRVKNIKI